MTTQQQMIDWEAAQLGKNGLPQQWAPGWTDADNDCAAFQSYAFFQDDRWIVVSDFANNFPHCGAVPFALACYRWPGSSDNYDHVGMVLTAPDSNGNFQSLEANTSGPDSGHEVAVKTRPLAYVVCFVMPPYTTPGPPPPPIDRSNDMATLYAADIPSPAPPLEWLHGAEAGRVYALAGDGVGAAAWLVTLDQSIADGWARAHAGNLNAVYLDWGSFVGFHDAYTNAAPVTEVSYP